MRSTVTVQTKDSGTSTHGTITKHSDNEHNGRFTKIVITKRCTVVAQITRHVKPTPILAHQYLSKTRYQNTMTYVCTGMICTYNMSKTYDQM